MPLDMQAITDHQINEIEVALLPVGKTFDVERREFIKELNTCDLQAVPGSGKTTVLLAKLMAFEKQLPLANGRGILVVSHTNTAVNEIKQKLGASCPNLFTYPNFIGTIQSFVDQFLAVPYYSLTFGKKPVRVDNEIHDEKVLKYRFSPAAQAWIRRKLDPPSFLKNLRLDANRKLCELPKLTPVRRLGEDTSTYKALHKMKVSLLEDGFLCFDDAYQLSEAYLSKFPSVIKLIQKRFAYIFVDEMQDMNKRQHDLLETLFFDATKETVYQRIGDRNQSIHSEDNEDDLVWTNRTKTLVLTGSPRLSPQIAAIVKPFGLYTDTQIDGKSLSTLKPHMLLYDDNNPQAILPFFADLVKKYIDEGRILNLTSPVKAIGWVGKDSNPNLTIPSYFPSYSSEKKVTKIDHRNLISYLSATDTGKDGFATVRKNVLNAILRVFRLCKIQNGLRDFTKAQLLAEIKLINPKLYKDFNHNLYLCCKDIVIGKNIDNAHERIRKYLRTLLLLFRGIRTLDPDTIDFLDSKDISGTPYIAGTILSDSRFQHNGVNVEITTVHAVKGETHSATLYLETYYYNYEVDKCLPQFLSTSSVGQTAARKKAAAKMMYVGFSRPTCLLCYASSKSRMLGSKARLEASGWDVIEL